MLLLPGNLKPVRRPTSQNRILFSLLALAAGWLLALATYCLASLLARGTVLQLRTFAVWSALYAFLGWALFLPATVLILRNRIPENSPLRSALLGSVIGLVAFLLLVGWRSGLWQLYPYPGLALELGGSAGVVYSLLIRRFYPDNTAANNASA
jgi:hypothetical protein